MMQILQNTASRLQFIYTARSRKRKNAAKSDDILSILKFLSSEQQILISYYL